MSGDNSTGLKVGNNRPSIRVEDDVWAVIGVEGNNWFSMRIVYDDWDDN